MPPGIGYGQAAQAASAFKRLPQIGANGQVSNAIQPVQPQPDGGYISPQAQNLGGYDTPGGGAVTSLQPQVNAESQFVPGDPTQQAAAAGGFDPSQLNVSGPSTGVQPAGGPQQLGQPLAQQTSVMDGPRYQQMLAQGFAPEQIEQLAGAFQKFQGRGTGQAQQAPGHQIGRGQAIGQPDPNAQVRPGYPTGANGQVQPAPRPHPQGGPPGQVGNPGLGTAAQPVQQVAAQGAPDTSWMTPWENTQSAGAQPGQGGGAMQGGGYQPAPPPVAAGGQYAGGQGQMQGGAAQPQGIEQMPPMIDPATGQVMGGGVQGPGYGIMQQDVQARRF